MKHNHAKKTIKQQQKATRITTKEMKKKMEEKTITISNTICAIANSTVVFEGIVVKVVVCVGFPFFSSFLLC